MTFTFEATDIVDNEDGTFTLETCNTFHLQPLFKITIGVIEYEITAVSHNTSITIKGEEFPTVNTFSVYNPFLHYGRVSDVNEELVLITDSSQKTPLMYVMQDFSETYYNQDEAKDRDSPLRILFMTQADNVKWTIDDHYNQAVKPMRNLAYSFIQFAEQQAYIGIIDRYEITDRIKLGKQRSETEKPKALFGGFLSGVELNVNLPVLKSVNDCCGSQIGMLMAIIKDQDGNIVTTLAPGQVYEVTIFDGTEDTIDANELTITDDLIT